MQNLKKISRLILLGSILGFNCLSGSARAALVVDTGPGLPVDGGIAIGSNQWVAGLFTLNDTYTINSVEGWMLSFVDDNFTSAIYTDTGAGVPGTQLFSQQFLLDADTTPPREASWHGASGLNWLLGPGNYWLSFEKHASVDLSIAVMPGEISGAPSPLSDYAVYFAGSRSSLTSEQALGMRIDADLTVVPVPAAVWLFGTALIGLVGLDKRRKAA